MLRELFEQKFGLLALPVYLLGYTGHLTTPLLALLSALLFGTAFLASSWRRGVRRHLDDTLDHALAILSLAPDGIHWAGLQTLASMVPDPPLATLASVKYGVPLGGVGDVIRRDYGYAVPWVIVPLGALSLGLALLVSIRELVSRRAGRAVDLLVLSFPALIALRLSPSLSIARFNVHIVTSLMFAVSWLAGQKRWHRWGEGAVAAAIALSIIPFFWMQGVLWNFRFSNRVEYIEFTRSDEFLERLAQFQSKWVAVGASSPARGALDSRPRDWEFVGEAAHAGTTVIYRHR